jgi:hypothetical protein
MAGATEKQRAGWWRVMSALQKHHGGFTLRILVDIVGDEQRKAVRAYLSGLVDENVLTAEASAPVGGLVTHTYRIINPGEAPPLRTADKGARQRVLWNAIRSMKMFREAEIAVAASTEELPIGRDAAGEYIRELVAAGYLAKAGQDANRFATPIYRLLPGMNTGPRAPIVMTKARRCFDLNLMRAVNLNASSRRAA